MACSKTKTNPPTSKEVTIAGEDSKKGRLLGNGARKVMEGGSFIGFVGHWKGLSSYSERVMKTLESLDQREHNLTYVLKDHSGC